MEQPVTNEKPSIAEIEVAKPSRTLNSAVPQYIAITEEEKALDRRINFKFDFCVILILSLGFIVSMRSQILALEAY